jgi:hypothetical protein
VNLCVVEPLSWFQASKLKPEVLSQLSIGRYSPGLSSFAGPSWTKVQVRLRRILDLEWLYIHLLS